MDIFRLDHLFEFVAGTQFVVGVLWVGLLSLSVALVILSWTRWGQSNSLQKCLVLSVLAHLLLVGYATTVQIVASSPNSKAEETIRVSITDGESLREETPRLTAPEQKPWEVYDNLPSAEPKPVEVTRVDRPEMSQPRRRNRAEHTGLSPLPLENTRLAESVRPDPKTVSVDDVPSRSPEARPAEPIEAPTAKSRRPLSAMVPVQGSPALRRHDLDEADALRRSIQGGVPSSLLKNALPVRRLANLPATPEPKTALAGDFDSLTRTTSSQPARLAGLRSPRTNPRDSEELPGGSPIPPATDHLRPPALAMRGSGSRVSLDGLPRDSAMAAGPPAPAINRRDRLGHQVPRLYRLRAAPDRSRLAQRNGASPETEAAVKAALKWLADNQSPDGRWRAALHGAGLEQQVAGRNRGGAGMSADTGISGLALLAFLAAGNTHENGDYSENVSHGLEYLRTMQARDGSLGGEAQTYAFMYCHAMATFALAEAYGMTGDQDLADPVVRATQFTLACQNPTTGGWRYKPGDDGDTSLLGWQIMALKSAQLAGIPVPLESQRGALRFLDAASSGPRRGLVAYRPTELPSRPMTAEGLACRLFLGMAPYDSSARESAEYLLEELPGTASANLYYWYYGTLGMYQLQGPQWRQWNRALRATLLTGQESRGEQAGSWPPDTVWGGYGGRVYSTALATLCLEVYYRFLPMHVEAALREAPPVYR